MCSSSGRKDSDGGWGNSTSEWQDADNNVTGGFGQQKVSPRVPKTKSKARAAKQAAAANEGQLIDFGGSETAQKKQPEKKKESSWEDDAWESLNN